MYIDNFGDSQLLLYQGALNMQKVQLKLQTINKLLRESLLPFIIIKADINLLKIDIPWSSLNSQPIKTEINGLNIIIEYQPITGVEDIIQDIIRKDNNNKLSIQNEMRKHKEIDEQLLKRFVKRLLLNLSFVFKDVQVELLIQQKYRLQFICQEFNTKCEDNLRINQEDPDQFHRMFKLETFFAKLIRFKIDEDSYSNQQLIALDQVSAFIERSKDTIHSNCEINNCNIIIEKDIAIIIKQILENQKKMNEEIQKFKIEPDLEQIILQDIIKVSKGFKLYMFINNALIQSQHLSFQINQLEILSKSFIQQQFYKLSYQEIELKYQGQSVILMTNKDEAFSVWPELFEEEDEKLKLINLFITNNQIESQVIQLTLYKINLTIYSTLSNKLQHILMEIKSFQDILFNNSEGSSNESQTQILIKTKKKIKLSCKLNIQKCALSIQDNLNSRLFKLLFQSQTILTYYKKKSKIKNLDLRHTQLQLQLFGQNLHTLLFTSGLEFQFKKEKSFSAIINLNQMQIRLCPQHFINFKQLSDFIKSITNSIKFDENNQQEKGQNQIEQKSQHQNQVQIKMNRISIELGESNSQTSFYSLLQIQIKEISLQMLLLNHQLQTIQGNLKIKLWLTYPMSKESFKLIDTVPLQFIWNIKQKDNIELENVTQNSLIVEKPLKIYVSQLSLSILIHLSQLIQGDLCIPQFVNRTKRKIMINLTLGQNKNCQDNIKLNIEPEQQIKLPKLYSNITSLQKQLLIEQMPIWYIKVGIQISETLEFWSNSFVFSLNQAYFNKFTIIDEIDKSEYDIFIKCKNNDYLITQNEKIQLKDVEYDNLQIGDSLFENKTKFTLLFKTSNQEQIQADPDSTKTFHTKLTEQSLVSISICCVNVQEIKFSFKDLLGKEAVLSFNFVKIQDNFYNILLSIEFFKDFKGQYYNKIMIKPFFKIVNLLPWSFSIGADEQQNETLNLPISVDAQLNNQIINAINEDSNNIYILGLEQFYQQLIQQNRKNTVHPSQQIYINHMQTAQYFLNFLNDGKYQLEIENSHHLIMIFRNNSLINNQMHFIVSKNTYQSQLKFLLLINKTNEYFVLIKNKSRLHINPSSQNCLENNIQKGDQYRMFITDASFQLLQMLDGDKFKVSTQTINNIYILELTKNEDRVIGREFKICFPEISIELNIGDKNFVKINFDLNIRLFRENHIDLLIQRFILEQNQNQVLSFYDLFSIIEISKAQSLNLLLINNFFFKIRDIKIMLNQQFINQLKQLALFIRLDPLMKLYQNKVSHEEYKSIWDSLSQQTLIVTNLIIEPIMLDININTQYINMQNIIQLPQYQCKLKKYKQSQMNQQILSFYLAYFITKIPTIQLLLQNIPNPLQFLTSSKLLDMEQPKQYQFFIQPHENKKYCSTQFNLLSKKCYQIKGEQIIKINLQIYKTKITINNQTIPLNMIQQVNRVQNKLIFNMYNNEQLILQSKNVEEILKIIQDLLI